MLRVIKTTDNKYIGLTAEIDPHNPPSVVEIGDGTKFEPIEWAEVDSGIWRIRNHNYTVWAVEV
jgi:hypothetical protein